MQSVEELISSAKKDIRKVISLDDLEKYQIEYLGRNGRLNLLIKDVRKLVPEKRKEFGLKINEAKNSVAKLIEEKRQKLVLRQDEGQFIDITLPGIKYAAGSLHPITVTIEEITRIFEKIGFIRMSYPEIDWEYFSFESLNMPVGHPARDDFETFYLDAPENKKYGKMLLSPHTSSGQVREMLRLQRPPIRMINIAKCYRPNWDAVHTPMFHQFEGLCVDRNINITHLKGAIDYFAKEFFGKNRQIRLRPHHFQFTEPSFEIDVSCGVCLGSGQVKGKKCKVCKSGWLELAGSGMVHPNVLKAGGINPNKYSGWAFGFGVERAMMMKEGITLDDMRILYGGDIRFLEQF